MKIEIEITRKRTLMAIFLIIVVATPSFIIGTNMGYHVGFKTGYVRALTDIKDKTGIEFEWNDLGKGRYEILAFYAGKLYAAGSAEIHIWVEHWRNGELLSTDHHEGVLTTIGKNWIEDQLGDSPATDPAKWISCSNDATPPDAAWTQLPSEINANGLTRAAGTYVSTGDGTWNISNTFSITGTQSVQLYGLQWVSTPVSDGNLLCADTSTQKNCSNGDTLKVTWMISVS